MRVKCLVEEYTEAEENAHKRASEDNAKKVKALQDSNKTHQERLKTNLKRLETTPEGQQGSIIRRIGFSKNQIALNKEKIIKFQTQKADLTKINTNKKAAEKAAEEKKKAEKQAVGPPTTSGQAADAVTGAITQAGTQAVTQAVSGASLKTVGTIGLGALAVYGAWKSYKYWKQKRAEAKTEEDRKQAEEKMAKEREKIRKEREKK
jgi:hypothetical protein